MTHVSVVVVGAGHCGLATSRHLAARSIDHLVVERGEVANSWRTERWDSLRLLTPNWMTRLPGLAYEGDDPDGYMGSADVVELITRYAAEGDAPVRTGTTVTALRPDGDGGYVVESDQGTWTADAVVLASGACNVASVPPVADEIPADVATLTAAGYRNPSQIAEGGVLVVGASASGIQIADELIRNGHEVTMAVGEHVRVPRRYRGRDILWWMDTSGVLSETWDQMDDVVRARAIPSMQLTGFGDAQTIDLNSITSRGARLVGRLSMARDGHLLFSGALKNICRLADLKLARLLDTLDTWAADNGIDGIEPPERFPDTVVPDDPCIDIDLRSGEIRTILWATGYKPELSWVEPRILNPRGRLIHEGGLTRHPGLYLMGMPFLRRRKSTLIDGADADAADITAHLAGHLDERARARGLATAP